MSRSTTPSASSVSSSVAASSAMTPSYNIASIASSADETKRSKRPASCASSILASASCENPDSAAADDSRFSAPSPERASLTALEKARIMASRLPGDNPRGKLNELPFPVFSVCSSSIRPPVKKRSA